MLQCRAESIRLLAGHLPPMEAMTRSGCVLWIPQARWCQQTLIITPSGWVRWNGINSNVEWHWEDVFSDDDSGNPTVHFTMAAGTYTLEIAYRDGCRLDAFVITDKLD